MEKKLRLKSAGLLLSCMFLFSCEAVFTTSVLEWARRDPSKMSAAQKVTYADDALASGDERAMKDAFDALKDTSDPALKPKVAELALGAAGVTNALADLLGDVAAGGTEENIKAAMEDSLASFSIADLSLIGDAAALIKSAEAGGAEVSADQYFTAGVGLLVVALNDAGGDSSLIDTSTGPGADAITFLNSARALFPPDSEAASLLGDFSGYF
jgi:hypothetical protein